MWSVLDMGALFTALHKDVGLELRRKANGRMVQVLDTIEAQTQVPRERVVYGVGGALGLYLVFGYFSELLCNFIGVAYPAYASYKAIETVQKDDDTQWLTYWTVYAALSLIDFGAESIMYYFPLYFLLKCVFLLWLYLPAFQGAEFLYNGFLKPFMARYASEIKEDEQDATKQAAVDAAK